MSSAAMVLAPQQALSASMSNYMLRRTKSPVFSSYTGRGDLPGGLRAAC